MTTIVVAKCSSAKQPDTFGKVQRVIPLGTPGWDVCDPIDPTYACSDRHDATLDSKFWASKLGWVWSDEGNGLSVVTDCPWCQGSLPRLTPEMLRAMDDPSEVDDEC